MDIPITKHCIQLAKQERLILPECERGNLGTKALMYFEDERRVSDFVSWFVGFQIVTNGW